MHANKAEPTIASNETLLPTDFAAYSLKEFCAAYRLSRAWFHLLARRGDAPATVRIGRKVLITKEAATAWAKRHTVHAASEAQAIAPQSRQPTTTRAKRPVGRPRNHPVAA